MRLENGTIVEVVTPDTVQVTPIQVALQGPPGPAGVQGPPGETDIIEGPPGPQGSMGPKGNIQYTGHGPPGVIIGAEPGHTYLDVDSGLVWTLS